MDKFQAFSLLLKQRQYWRSQEPDDILARRAERVFFRVAMVFFFVSLWMAGVAAVWHIRPFYFAAVAQLVAGAFLYRRSPRVSQVVRVLAEINAPETF